MMCFDREYVILGILYFVRSYSSRQTSNGVLNKVNENQSVNPKDFWEDKILSWERDRYCAPNAAPNILERLASRASDSLRFRLWATGELLAPQVKGKRILELGCGSGFLAPRLLAVGAEGYIGIDISESAIVNARALAAKDGVEDKLRFEVDSVSNLGEYECDIVFSLGLLDWLADDELDRMFAATAGAEYLHAIAEKRASVSQWIHRVYVQLSYGHRTGSYRPRYFSVAEIEAMARRYTDKPVRAYRDPRLSFGAFITTLDFNPDVLVNEPTYPLR